MAGDEGGEVEVEVLSDSVRTDPSEEHPAATRTINTPTQRCQPTNRRGEARTGLRIMCYIYTTIFTLAIAVPPHLIAHRSHFSVQCNDVEGRVMGERPRGRADP